jgi:3-keto-L-gulonate-6-phosphate decarboxylase
VKKLRDERAVAKADFIEVDGFTQIQTIKQAWTVAKAKKAEALTLFDK